VGGIPDSNCPATNAAKRMVDCGRCRPSLIGRRRVWSRFRASHWLGISLTGPRHRSSQCAHPVRARLPSSGGPDFAALAAFEDTTFLVSASSQMHLLSVGSSAFFCVGRHCSHRCQRVKHPVWLPFSAAPAEWRTRQYLPRRNPGMRSELRRRSRSYTHETGTFSNSATSSIVRSDWKIERWGGDSAASRSY